MSSDHPVFKRFSRQQMIIRRRNIGFQTLVFDASLPKEPRCKSCKRQFNSIWKEYMCHVCGFWICEPCSSVIEREREILRVQYVRTCFECLSMLNKWSDSELLVEYAIAPWIVQDSKRQLSLHLSDIFHKHKSQRHAALVILQRLGMGRDVSATVLDEISEVDWITATTQDISATHSSSALLMREGNPTMDEDTHRPSIEKAQHLVQQCFEVVIHELSIGECKFAESDGTREYQIVYNPSDELIQAPLVPNEAEQVACIERYGLLSRKVLREEMDLICHLAAKELDVPVAGLYVIVGDEVKIIGTSDGQPGPILERQHTFGAFGLTSPLPLLVRDALLDIRFRNLQVVRGMDGRFYFGCPILSDTGVVIATLCVFGPVPRKSITTMQYSIMKMLSEMVTSLWNDEVNQLSHYSG